MRTHIKNPCIRFWLATGLSLLLAGRATAQTFTVLHNFSGTDGGARPYRLILSGDTLYGTASFGGNGTVFKLKTDGNGFTNLYSFTGSSDGARPGSLILSGDMLYGTAGIGGDSGNGTVFKVDTNGTGFMTLHSFTTTSCFGCPNSDGAIPNGLILSGDMLYGTAYHGGSSGNGTVFKVKTDGTGFTNLYSFTGSSDGAEPGSLILSGDMLYGTADSGGDSGSGTVFKVNTNGTGFMTLHRFTALSFSTNSDGAKPYGLILSDNALYGTASWGGSSGSGTVFAVNTNGMGFTNLHTFSATSHGTNIEGASPDQLILSGDTLYGTAVSGGNSGNGTLFAVHTDGTAFTNLHSFTAVFPDTEAGINSDGANPLGPWALSGNTLYGTAHYGGSSGYGTVFGLLLPISPQLTIIRSGANVVLTWTNAGFNLQTAPAVTGPFTNLPAATSPYTNPLTAPHQFFRLIAN